MDNNNYTLPVFAKGFSRARLALKTTFTRVSRRSLAEETVSLGWDDRFVQVRPGCVRNSGTLADLGYKSALLGGVRPERITAIASLRRWLADEAIMALRHECTALESYSEERDWIITKRTRGATRYSKFINDMMNSRAFLLAVSRIAGVPLVPYPLVNARSQVNYYYPRHTPEQKQQVGMWHTDGTCFVLNMLMSDASEFQGGEFLYHEGPVDTFHRETPQRELVRKASLVSVGDSLFIHGSKLFHGVEPVVQGRRMSLVLSFHYPYSSEDVNEFWHLASDDGIGQTLGKWMTLKRDLTRRADEQYERLGIDPITFDDLLPKDLDASDEHHSYEGFP
ncbi:2OG-Fe(II) oxygenase [Pseudomonas syringae]|uniref:2OG-Fe(II) oxygenase n=1 Tax=Pseudomonas syringae TaxID=317 RepID=UPI000411C915|nr:2OG-Fe(II) oxygenase [Pseudomonas syringae]